MKKKLGLIIGGILVMSSLTGCHTKNKVEIEQSFDKVLAMYPTKNLEDFYDIEGFRDSEFEENDKGVWVLNSSMSASKSEDSPLITEGMMIRLNRNTREGKGYYYIKENWNDLTKEKKNEKYPVVIVGNTIKPVDELEDEKIKEKIEEFQFFVQYGNFEKLDSYKNIKKMYNPEVPMYELEYQLTDTDKNVKSLHSKYDIPTKKAPILRLKGRGDLEGDSTGYKQLEFRFDNELSVFFKDFIDFQPQNKEDLVNE